MVEEQCCSRFTRTFMLRFKAFLQFHIYMSRKESLEEFIPMTFVSTNSMTSSSRECFPLNAVRRSKIQERRKDQRAASDFAVMALEEEKVQMRDWIKLPRSFLALGNLFVIRSTP